MSYHEHKIGTRILKKKNLNLQIFTIYMGGLALMVISPKFGNFSPPLCPHWGLFNHIRSLLVLSSEPIGRSESLYAKI